VPLPTEDSAISNDGCDQQSVQMDFYKIPSGQSVTQWLLRPEQKEKYTKLEKLSLKVASTTLATTFAF